MFPESPFTKTLLQGKTCLVTGGSSGIGFEIARQLGLHGANVVITGRRRSVLQDATDALTKQGVTIRYVAGDVRSYQDCQLMVSSTVSYFGSLNVLINAAAGNFLAAAEKLTSNGMKTVLDIDALGTFNACRAAFPELQASGDACVVNVSATLHYGATWYQVHASAAKAAVDSITRSLALEWGTYGIRVCGIAPGPIEGTAGLAKLAPGDQKAVSGLWRDRIPLGRPGQTWDIAMGVLFLCSTAGRNITGHTLVADGGEWMWRPPLLKREDVLAASRAIEAKSRTTGVVRQKKANDERAVSSKEDRDGQSPGLTMAKSRL